ncbi:MAG: type I pullulanase [Bacilli bacterium]|nr:type I pullulanase [Bacilli bacterium]
MKAMKITLATVLFVFSFLFFHVQNVLASSAETLVVHYHRFDDRSSEFDLWLWTGGESGSNYAFNGTDSYGVKATIDLTSTPLSGVDSIGIIVKVGDFSEKDIEENRFISMTNPNASGEVHVYLLQGESYISYVSSDTTSCNKDVFLDPDNCAQDLSVRIVDSYFDDNYDIFFMATVPVAASNVVVLEDDIVVPYTGFSTGASGTLHLNTPPVSSKKYVLEITVGEDTISSIVRFGNSYDSTIFQNAYNFTGWLGVQYTNLETTFRLWAPVSSEVEINLYSAGHTISTRSDGADSPYETHSLTYFEKGVWTITIPGDLKNTYYTYSVINSGTKIEDIPDPYGQTFGLNGLRSMVIDFDSANPEGWDLDQGIDGYTNANEAIIYELHVRDLTSQLAWGGPLEYSKTYMGFTVLGTTYTNPITGVTVSTGLDHLVELGITHVHLLPTYDQDWNDERNFLFNWGYNPQNYNSPEGGYSTDPYDGNVRVNEYKQMVMALHNNGINIIQDVVYNHTGPGAYYSFNRIVPNYFYRLNSDGSFSNGTGVGNETASERFMVRKFIVDSVTMWAEEYHIDGFRFDLMAVHDVATMNLVAIQLENIDADIFVYGEPWGGGTIALDYNLQAGKNNLSNMTLISAFNDQFRDTIKGSTWDAGNAGYVSDSEGVFDVMNGIKGSTSYWGNTSTQSINYVSAHDNLTLYDKLLRVNGVTTYTQEVDYQTRLATSIIMFSQGIPFFQGGDEFLRTKGGNENSYDASDLVNQLSWVRKSNNMEVFEYYKGIIEIRKQFESFHMITKADIDEHLEFLYPDGYGMIGYRLTKNSEDILVYHNGGKYSNDIILPEGAWKLLSDRDEAGLAGLGTYSTRYPIEKAETLVFVKGEQGDVIESPLHSPEITNTLAVMFEGGTFNLTSSSNISAYQINDGDFISVDIPAKTISVTGLSSGVYEFRVKDIYGGISEPFTFTVLERVIVEQTCDEFPDQEKCQPLEQTCDEFPDQEKCQPVEQTCTENPNQDICFIDDSDNTNVKVIIILAGSVLMIGIGFVIIKKIII